MPLRVRAVTSVSVGIPRVSAKRPSKCKMFLKVDTISHAMLLLHTYLCYTRPSTHPSTLLDGLPYVGEEKEKKLSVTPCVDF